MKNYSQTNEQEVILDYFKGFTGTFLDLGANDGITLSNTYALSLIGWQGVYVEASPTAFEMLVDNTDVDSFMFTYCNCAVGKENKRMTFYESGELITKKDRSLVSTFHQSEMDRFKKVKYNPIEVECYTWEYILREAIQETRSKFDFISMDIEGSELEVLPQMDLSEVKLFCIEWNSKPELKKAYEPYFKGFKLIHTTGENLIYAR
jgi:FkbM family methyltransferase